mmetsp:Transcript_41917/g.72845  ORF Transcript_41917/g.72845 Transcript_41917/m.72845 type:complete len:299 (-) Transcript_41917:1028-1924(-)
MVSGLIQHQQSGLNEQRSGQGDTHAPTSREETSRAGLHLAVEAQSEKNASGPRLRRGRADQSQLCVHLSKSGVEGIVGAARLQCLHDLLLLLDQLPTHLVCAQHGVHRGGVVSHHLLLHIEIIDSGRDLQLARGNHLQQSRLACTVGTDQTVPTAVHDTQLGVHEELLLVRRDRHVGDDDIQSILPHGVVDIHNALGDCELGTLCRGLQRLLVELRLTLLGLSLLGEFALGLVGELLFLARQRGSALGASGLVLVGPGVLGKHLVTVHRTQHAGLLGNLLGTLGSLVGRRFIGRVLFV